MSGSTAVPPVRVIPPDAELVNALARLLEAAKGTLAEAEVARLVKTQCAGPLR